MHVGMHVCGAVNVLLYFTFVCPCTTKTLLTCTFVCPCRGVGTGPADPAAAGPKFALSIEIETHNSKKC